MSNARLRLAFAWGTLIEACVGMLGEPSGSPRPLLVGFADKALRAFPTPLHAYGARVAP